MIIDHQPDLLRRVNRLRIHCSALIDQQLAGSSASTFKGQGIEFEETRPYQAGDDVRAIDWRITAKAGRPFVKLFREDRQTTVYLLVDGSGSLAAPPLGATPWQRVVEIAGVLALLASADGSRVGMLLFNDQVVHAVPPASGTQHAMRILRDLIDWDPTQQGTNLAAPLRRLCRTEPRRCVAIVLSDFLDADHDAYERALRAAAAMHDIVPIICHHPLQRELPRCGLLMAMDPESGQSLLVDTLSRRQREQYRQAAEAIAKRREELFGRLRIAALGLSTTDNIAVKLHQFFDRRGANR